MSAFRVAIVTGGGQGIGAAIVTTLLDEGYKVCVAEIQEEAGSRFVAEQQKKYGGEKVVYLRCDVTKEAEYRKAFDFARSKLGRVDLLVNNAGIIDEKNPQKTINVNTMGPIYGCRVALDVMGRSKGGRGGIVINIASIFGLLGTQYCFPSYVASKHAVVGLTRSYGLPYHFDRDGVLFSALCPSHTKTPLQDDLKAQTGIDHSHHPLMMSAEYVAKAVLKAIADKMNGSILFVSKDKGYVYIGYQEELKDYVV